MGNGQYGTGEINNNRTMGLHCLKFDLHLNIYRLYIFLPYSSFIHEKTNRIAMFGTV